MYPMLKEVISYLKSQNIRYKLELTDDVNHLVDIDSIKLTPNFYINVDFDCVILEEVGHLSTPQAWSKCHYDGNDIKELVNVYRRVS